MILEPAFCFSVTSTLPMDCSLLPLSFSTAGIASDTAWGLVLIAPLGVA